MNDLCTHPSAENLLASVGDDCVCRLWDLQQAQMRSEFKLGSPGMTVRWHDQDPVKVGVVTCACMGWRRSLWCCVWQLLVAEKCGRIRIYDVSSDSPLQSLDCPSPPLLSADWAPSNSLVVGGVAGGSWYRWDLSQSR